MAPVVGSTPLSKKSTVESKKLSVYITRPETGKVRPKPERVTFPTGRRLYRRF